MAKASVLPDAIAAHLAAGLPLDAASLETILQALGEGDPARAFALLAEDPEASEHAPLLALAFSPGQATRRALEPALAEADLDAPCAGELARQTAQRVADGAPAALLLPDGMRLALAPGLADIEGFVRRLRPEATAPAGLRRVISGRFAGGRLPALHDESRHDEAQGKDPERDMALDVLITLRHSRLAWSPARVFFLAALLERAQEQDDIAALAAWAVRFLDLAGPEFPVREALRRRRQALASQLRQAEAQEEAAERASFEVRLSQGQRQGYVHGPDLRAELAQLDRACRLVLGLRGEELTEVSVRDLGQALDAEELLRIFPG